MDYITQSLAAVNCFWRQLLDIFKEEQKSRPKPPVRVGRRSRAHLIDGYHVRKFADVLLKYSNKQFVTGNV